MTIALEKRYHIISNKDHLPQDGRCTASQCFLYAAFSHCRYTHGCWSVCFSYVLSLQQSRIQGGNCRSRHPQQAALLPTIHLRWTVEHQKKYNISWEFYKTHVFDGSSYIRPRVKENWLLLPVACTRSLETNSEAFRGKNKMAIWRCQISRKELKFFVFFEGGLCTGKNPKFPRMIKLGFVLDFKISKLA